MIRLLSTSVSATEASLIAMKRLSQGNIRGKVHRMEEQSITGTQRSLNEPCNPYNYSIRIHLGEGVISVIELTWPFDVGIFLRIKYNDQPDKQLL